MLLKQIIFVLLLFLSKWGLWGLSMCRHEQMKCGMFLSRVWVGRSLLHISGGPRINTASEGRITRAVIHNVPLCEFSLLILLSWGCWGYWKSLALLSHHPFHEACWARCFCRLCPSLISVEIYQLEKKKIQMWWMRVLFPEGKRHKSWWTDRELSVRVGILNALVKFYCRTTVEWEFFLKLPEMHLFTAFCLYANS